MKGHLRKGKTEKGSGSSLPGGLPAVHLRNLCQVPLLLRDHVVQAQSILDQGVAGGFRRQADWEMEDINGMVSRVLMNRPKNPLIIF